MMVKFTDTEDDGILSSVLMCFLHLKSVCINCHYRCSSHVFDYIVCTILQRFVGVRVC